MDAGHPQLFEPAALGPVMLRNRIIKAATFEGMSWRGSVSDALVDRPGHRRFRRRTRCVLVPPAGRPGLRLLT